MYVLLCSQPVHAVLNLNDGSGTVIYPDSADFSFPNNTTNCDISASSAEEGILSVKYTITGTINREFFVEYTFSGTASFLSDISSAFLVTSTVDDTITLVEGGLAGDDSVKFLVQLTTSNVSEGDEFIFCLPGVKVTDYTPVRINFRAEVPSGIPVQPVKEEVLLRFGEVPSYGGSGIIYHADRGDGIWKMNPDGSGKTQLTDHGWYAKYSPDYTQIAFGEYYRNGIWVMNTNGTNQEQLTTSGSVPTWSPDGLKIAYSEGNTRGTSRRIWVMNADGTGARKLSDNPGSAPKWSPDGSKIAYHGEVNNGIWLINPDGSGETKLYKSGGYPDWSPDGTKIVYVSLSDWHIWTMNTDGTDKKKLTNHKGILPEWSPDGTKIAYEELTENKGIWVINADGTNDHLINEEGHAPDWSVSVPPDEKTVCGPGSHWVDNCPQGVDKTLSSATLTVAVPCGGAQQTVRLNGPTVIKRGAGSPTTHSIDTEIISMVLANDDGTITFRGGINEDVSTPSKGKITERSDTETANNFFEVFFEIDMPGVGTFHNKQPHHMKAIIREVPPINELHFPASLTETEILDANGNTVACLVNSEHVLKEVVRSDIMIVPNPCDPDIPISLAFCERLWYPPEFEIVGLNLPRPWPECLSCLPDSSAVLEEEFALLPEVNTVGMRVTDILGEPSVLPSGISVTLGGLENLSVNGPIGGFVVERTSTSDVLSATLIESRAIISGIETAEGGEHRLSVTFDASTSRLETSEIDRPAMLEEMPGRFSRANVEAEVKADETYYVHVEQYVEGEKEPVGGITYKLRIPTYPISVDLPPIFNSDGEQMLLFSEGEKLPIENLSFGNISLEVQIDNADTDDGQLGILTESEPHLSGNKLVENGVTIGKIASNEQSKAFKVEFNDNATSTYMNRVIGNITYTPTPGDLMPSIRTIKLTMSDGSRKIAKSKVDMIVGPVIKLFANENGIVEADTLAGIFETTDGNVNGQAYVYSLVEGEGDTHNSLFTIIPTGLGPQPEPPAPSLVKGDELKTQTEISFDENEAANNLYFVRVKTTNKLYSHLYFEKPFGILVIKPNTELSVPNNELSITYHFTAETLYSDIKIINTNLKWGYVPRSTMDEKCATGFASRSCWSYDDIVTKETTLSTTEVNELKALMERLNIMNLQEEYGEEPERRSYPYNFSFRFQGEEKSIVYRSSPDVPPMPTALKTIQETLGRLVREKIPSSD